MSDDSQYAFDNELSGDTDGLISFKTEVKLSNYSINYLVNKQPDYGKYQDKGGVVLKSPFIKHGTCFEYHHYIFYFVVFGTFNCSKNVLN